ncbi:Regulator of RpoS [Paraburkholderia kirstenboschensis]|uniref:response regulator n=1 Tax=Paraburkholderia kirstenboschensis TaxID=1245436 RepID=UPI000B266727|nr:response regulator [Paraburkholderia kirstenboschensis]CAD6552820.1 Regulator of RpoS [Paraburkholderia kirstenboschensis]
MNIPKLFDRAPRPWTARRVPVNGARLRVLVVDDNHNAALALAAYLSLEDLESRAVFGGSDAIEVGIAWVPHVILMDISMPQCNGYEAARALRRHKRTTGIAIVAHTAFDEIEVRRHLTDSEFDGYVQKGWPPGLLLALITKLAE